MNDFTPMLMLVIVEESPPRVRLHPYIMTVHHKQRMSSVNNIHSLKSYQLNIRNKQKQKSKHNITKQNKQTKTRQNTKHFGHIINEYGKNTIHICMKSYVKLYSFLFYIIFDEQTSFLRSSYYLRLICQDHTHKSI